MAIAATVAVERLGGRLGGLLAGVPTTIVPATLGFWWTRVSPESFETALYAVPGGMLVNAGFLYCWRVFPGVFTARGVRGLLAQVTFAALGIWSVLAFAFVSLAHSEAIPIHILGPVAFGLQVVAGVAMCWSKTLAPKGSKKVRLSTLAMRGLLAGGAIYFSVWLANLGNPLLAGVASVFPVIFLTTMVSVWLAQGKAVPMGAVGPIMLGSSSVSAYSLCAICSLPSFGIVVGPLVAWTVAILVVSLPSWLFLRSRQ